MFTNQKQHTNDESSVHIRSRIMLLKELSSDSFRLQLASQQDSGTRFCTNINRDAEAEFKEFPRKR
jgi:hypothetical protein